MAYGLGRCNRVDTYNGNTPVESHTGDRRAFQRRYERKAVEAVSNGIAGIANIGPKLLTWAADARNLRVAYDFLRRYGGWAPGPDGMVYSDLTNSEAWGLARALGQAIRGGTYQPGCDRIVKIRKTSGRGNRILRLQNIRDRVVARAIVQIIQPLLDPGFDDNSFGYRPGRDRRHALATALYLAAAESRMVWVLEDVRDAFDNVPLKRLLDVIRYRLPAADGLWALIERTLMNGTKRGLRQGSPLSPISMNLYLDHHLDRVWRKQRPDTPLLRSADDLLVMCRAEKEALETRELLRRILTPAGMPLKEVPHSTVRNLNDNHKADWLGFGISMGGDDLETQISAASWSALEERLQLAHNKPASPLRATGIVRGWVEQIGPCYPHEDQDQVTARISDIAKAATFEELAEIADVKRHWRTACARWCKLSQAITADLSYALVTAERDDEHDGFADRDVFFAALRRSDGAPDGAPSLFDSPRESVATPATS